MPRPKVGELFQNRYLIVSELGAGGMGMVFRAKQLDADREVALKSIRSDEIHDKDTVARFYREFQLLSKLTHPNIVTIYGLALDDNSLPFAICELIEGENLRRLLIKDGPLNWERACKIILQIANAMQYAHENNVIHRDLKPENVMLLSVPEPDFVKLVDFGLSRIVHSDGEASQMLTSTGQLIGSSNYMSPELIKQRVDHRSDIYSLGCLLFELLSGEYLFDADTSIGVVYKHTSEDPTARFKSIKVPVPKRLLATMSRMLAKDPEQRYQSMAELSNDVQSIIENPQSLAEPAGGNDTADSAKLSPVMLLVFSIGLFGLLGISIFFFNSHSTKPKATREDRTSAAEQVPIPARGSPMLTLVEREKNLQVKEILLRRWLDKYGNDPARPFDRLLVLQAAIENYYGQAKMVELADAMEKLMALMPSVPETDLNAIITKDKAYRLLWDVYLYLGKRKDAVLAARSSLKMLEAKKDQIGWQETGNFAVTTLLLCGEYATASAYQQQFVASVSDMKGQPIYYFYRLLGDLQACMSKFDEAKRTYEKSLSVLPINKLDKSVSISAIAGLGMGEHGYSGRGIYNGVPILCMAERQAYLDKELGERNFREGLQLLEDEQATAGEAKKGMTALALAYMVTRSAPQSWLMFCDMARELGLPTEAERCARMAVQSATEDTNNKDQKLELASALTEQALCLLELGKESQAKQVFLRLNACMQKMDKKVRTELGYKNIARLSELAALKGYKASAASYLDAAQQYLNENQKLAGASKNLGLEMILRCSGAVQANGRTADAEAYFKVLEEMPTTDAVMDVSPDYVYLGLAPEALREFSEFYRVVPDYAVVAVIEEYLRFGWVERAEKYLHKKEKSVPDQISLSLAYFKLGEYHAKHNQPAKAIPLLQKSHDMFVNCSSTVTMGRGLPLNVRCKLLMYSCRGDAMRRPE